MAGLASALERRSGNLCKSVHGVGARKGYWRLRVDPLNPDNLDGFQGAEELFVETEEGRAALRIDLRHELSRKVLHAFKSSRPDFRCEACGTNMEEVYGALGAGYIEAHHRVPVALIEDRAVTKQSDLARSAPTVIA